MSRTLAGPERPGSRSAERMLAMRLVGPGRFEPVEVGRPGAGPGQVVVRLEGCGVCGSNLPVWEGRAWFSYPLEPGAPGHEGWGEVVEVGTGVEGRRVGDRVAVLSSHAFAEYDAVAADQTAVIPESLRGVDAPGEPLACAMNVMRRSGVAPGTVVGVVGVGFLGGLLVGLAHAAGAEVVACSRRGFSRDLGVRMGASAAFGLDEVGPMQEYVRSRARGRLCPVVIEAGGVQETLDAASALVETYGRLVVAGYHQDGLRSVNMQRWNWDGIDVVNAHERDPSVYVRGMEAAMSAMAEGTLDPSPLLTHDLPLDRLNEAMGLLRDRPEGFVKAVVRA